MTKFRSLLLAAAALVAGLVVSASFIAGADADTEREPSLPSSCADKLEPFKANAAGQTFGRYCMASGIRPDFAPGWTDAGVHGYFLLDEWMPERDKNGELVEGARQIQPDENGDIKIRVFDFDGKTVIGWATVARVSSE